MANVPADQQKLVKLVNKFRGISQYKNLALIGMDDAIDLLNVMPSNIGNLEKLRVPILRGPENTAGAIIDSMFYFTQGIGTRMVFVNPGASIGFYTDPGGGLQWVYTQVSAGAAFANARMYYVSSNNYLFMGNGTFQCKFDGALTTAWGIQQPTTVAGVLPVALGWTLPILSIQRSAGGVITLQLNTAGIPFAPTNGVSGNQFNIAPAVGDVLNISGVVGDPTFNGTWTVATNTGAGNLTLTSAGGASGPFANDGNGTIYGCPCGPFNATSIARHNNVTTIFFTNNDAILTNEQVACAGFANPSINGSFTVINSSTTFLQFNQIGPDIPVTAVGAGTIAGGFTNLLTPRTWRVGWGDTVSGGEGPSSDPPSLSLPNNNGLVTNYRAYLTIQQPTVVGPAALSQAINVIWLYATQDGGGIWVLENPLDTGYSRIPNIGTQIIIGDAMADSKLDATQQANFINFPPPAGIQYLVEWQGRIFGAGMSSAPQDCVFSGYDQILRGRPEQSFPPLNRIRLAIGADPIRGFGVLMNGVVLWDQSNKMYLFEGTIEDIIATQPVLLTAYLANEPWQTGLSSSGSVQSTPRGVIWVAADLTVQIWNGIFYGELIGPRDLSVNIYPLMKRITTSTKQKIQSAFFNWLDRDWYVILVCLDGSIVPNYMIFFDLSQEGADNLGIWVANIQADSICVKEDPDGTRRLIMSQGGKPYELTITSTSTNGVHSAPTSTAAELSAYWTSGYWQDAPHMMKMYRYGRLTCDQDGFQLITTIINDETSRLRDANPFTKNLKMTAGGRFATNHKGRRQGFKIIFPIQDVDASVLELYSTAIALAEI